MTAFSFRWPAPKGAVFTQDAADAQVGKTLYTGGINGAWKGAVDAAFVADDGRSMELTVALEDGPLPEAAE
jgi:hypothetical protein